MILARDLRKAFGKKQVLRDAGFEARPGEITLLIGPNGSGKSTTMRLLAGLSRPDVGRIEIAGFSTARNALAARGALSFLPQNPAFHPRFTCLQILRFYAALRNVDRARVEEVLDLAGLGDCAREPSGVLSGGMRQRLGLALLLLPQTPVLLLDEPGLSLDPEWRRRLHEILRGESHNGRTVLVTTHLLAEWNGKSDRCLLCRDGTIEDGVNPAALAFDVAAPAYAVS